MILQDLVLKWSLILVWAVIFLLDPFLQWSWSSNLTLVLQSYLTLGVAVGGIHEFADHSTSSGYVKPWRNVEAKVRYLSIWHLRHIWHLISFSGNVLVERWISCFDALCRRCTTSIVQRISGTQHGRRERRSMWIMWKYGRCEHVHALHMGFFASPPYIYKGFSTTSNIFYIRPRMRVTQHKSIFRCPATISRLIQLYGINDNAFSAIAVLYSRMVPAFKSALMLLLTNYEVNKYLSLTVDDIRVTSQSHSCLIFFLLPRIAPESVKLLRRNNGRESQSTTETNDPCQHESKEMTTACEKMIGAASGKCWAQVGYATMLDRDQDRFPAVRQATRRGIRIAVDKLLQRVSRPQVWTRCAWAS